MQLLLSVLLVFVLAGAVAAILINAAGERHNRRADLRDLRRFAEEVSVAAERASATAQRARTTWLATVDEVAAAWSAFEEVDARTTRLITAAALPTPATPQTPSEYADRERYLHRAAVAAVARGELPAAALAEVLASRNGWDSRRHPVEQELALSRAHRTLTLAAYRAAADRERSAWREAEAAAVASGSLRAEADAARLAVPGVPWESTEIAATRAVAPAAALRTAEAH